MNTSNTKLKEAKQQSKMNETNDDFTFEDAKELDDEMVNKLQEKTGKTREEVESLINKK